MSNGSVILVPTDDDVSVHPFVREGTKTTATTRFMFSIYSFRAARLLREDKLA